MRREEQYRIDLHEYAVEHEEEYRKACHELIDNSEDPDTLVTIYTILIYRRNKKASAKA